MLALIRTFLLIALRRLGPEDLPDSSLLFGLAVIAYAVAQVVIVLPLYGPGATLLRAVVLDVALLYACVWGLLRFTGRPARFRQTLTALFGTGALLTVLMVPLNSWFTATSVPDQPAVLPTVGILLMLIWSLVVNGHIVARALSAPLGVGLVFSVIYFFINYLVIWQTGPGGA